MEMLYGLHTSAKKEAVPKEVFKEIAGKAERR